MTGVDVIVISNAHNAQTYKLTSDALNSIWNSESGNLAIELHVTVVEQTKTIWPECQCQTIRYNRDFNYNALLNMAMRNTSQRYVLWLNNDVIVSPRAISEMLYWCMLDYPSLGAADPLRHKQFIDSGFGLIEGYEIGKHVTGWCIFTRRSVWEKIGGLCEDVVFWYSDNAYAEQLKRAGIEHFLCTRAHVRHLEMQTTKHFPSRIKWLQQGQKKLFDQWRNLTS